MHSWRYVCVISWRSISANSCMETCEILLDSCAINGDPSSFSVWRLVDHGGLWNYVWIPANWFYTWAIYCKPTWCILGNISVPYPTFLTNLELEQFICATGSHSLWLWAQGYAHLNIGLDLALSAGPPSSKPELGTSSWNIVAARGYVRLRAGSSMKPINF